MLFKEYAIEPCVLANWKDARYFIDNTGVRHGRLIAEFPKSWFRMVMDACATRPDMERKRIMERLRKAKECNLVTAARPYRPDQEWCENAVHEHERDPFAGVIARNASVNRPAIVCCEDVDEECACWKTSTDCVVSRRARELADAAAPLLRASKQIVFIDQHFDFSHAYLNPLELLLSHAVSGASPSRIEYHLGEKTGTSEHVENQLRKRVLPRLRSLGNRASVFIRWRTFEDQPADKLHPRYILTEKGGMRFDYGLGEGNAGETTDVGILDWGVYERRWHDFLPESTTYEFLDGWVVGNGAVRRAFPSNGLFVAA